jgi:tetrahydromethanopterin S-methyltransferase subunit G
MSDYEKARRLIETESALQELEESLAELEKTVENVGPNNE